MKGTIKRIISDKGYGFITVEGEEKDLFFHRTTVSGEFDDLREGDEIEFEIEETDRGTQATNVTTV
ncbi:MAG: cold shock domain-containing protein [Candidatus Heimdallarchaeota archaeon]|nr:cold shock domain-containing protein [Candidatus Heimdallarchaeota archaeon]MCK4771011.1 cold shock domain-containing protein [Candidatus Heimdallarchaeota archaeon]